MDSDDESENISEIRALNNNSSVFAATLDETEFCPRLPESSFSCGTVIPLILDAFISFIFTSLILIKKK